MTANKRYWLLGVDGGGTSCRVRLCEPSGKVLGHGIAGSANVRLGPRKVYQSIEQATEKALLEARLDKSILKNTYVTLGLAGAVSNELNSTIINYPHPFATLSLVSDAVIACLGAHKGEDGGILILGTGSCAMFKQGDEYHTLGGWGLSISDHGSGAKLGQDFVREALLAFEGLIPSTPLSKAFMATHANSASNLLHWADQAKPSDYGALVSLIIHYYHQKDTLAIAMIDKSLDEIFLLLEASQRKGINKIALMGGYATFISSLIDERFSQKHRRLIVPAEGDALDGAIIMASDLANRTLKCN